METKRIVQKEEDIDSLLDIEPVNARHTSMGKDQKGLRMKLREAQNANRGRPKANSMRTTLQQLNVSCDRDICRRFDELSLQEGKTKRVLIEEGLNMLFAKYKRS